MADLTTIYGNLDPDVIRRAAPMVGGVLSATPLALAINWPYVGNVDVMEAREADGRL